jgi:UrcA family protein
MHISRLLACVLVAVGFGVSAQAGPSIATVQVRVSTEDLDLTTAAGAQAVLARLSRAATAACGGTPDGSPLIRNAVQKFELCRARAVAGAVAQSQSPVLQTQFAATREGQILRLAAN